MDSATAHVGTEVGLDPASTADGVMVRAVGVVRTYDTGRVQVNALRGIDLAIKRSEMVAIMGPSGCGKTTLLNCLSGLDQIDSGEVFIEGVSLYSMSDTERTRYRARRMGFVFQFYNLLAVLTAAENVELPLLLSGVGSREARQRAIDSLALVGLAVAGALGLIVAYDVIRDASQSPSWESISFTVPWLSLGIIFVIVYVAALLTTYLPALQASRVYPAEALRYE